MDRAQPKLLAKEIKKNKNVEIEKASRQNIRIVEAWLKLKLANTSDLRPEGSADSKPVSSLPQRYHGHSRIFEEGKE